MKKGVLKLIVLLFIILVALSICLSVNATEGPNLHGEKEQEAPDTTDSPKTDGIAVPTPTGEDKTENTTNGQTTAGTKTEGTTDAKEAEEVKLTTLKFDDKEIAVVKTAENNVIKIPTELEFTGENVERISVLFKNEAGDQFGPTNIYTKEGGKKDLEISIDGEIKEGEKYYLTDINLMKKVGNNYETIKQYVTSKSSNKANGTTIVNHSTDYYFVLTSATIETKKTEEQSPKDETPKTGNAEYIIIRNVLTISAAAVVVFIIVKNKKRA